MLPDSVVGPLKTHVELAALDTASEDDAHNLIDEIQQLRTWLALWQQRLYGRIRIQKDEK